MTACEKSQHSRNSLAAFGYSDLSRAPSPAPNRIPVSHAVREGENWIAWLCYSFRHMPPRQLWPAEQEFPHRPQFCESLMKLPLLTHLPMQLS